VEEEKKQFNVYLPSAVIRRVKHAAIDTGQSLSDFVQVALERYLESLEASGTTEPDSREGRA